MAGIADPGALLRRVRRRHGLTQAELARRAGTSQPVVSAYEHGHRDPSFATLRRLVSAAGDQLLLTVAEPGPALPPPRTREEHAERLADVLGLADAIPARTRAGPLTMPRLVSRR